MNASEIKLKIIHEVDSLENSKLEELYGIILNFINSKRDLDKWIDITEDEKQGIKAAIKELDSGKGIPHDVVMKKFREKYSNV